MKTIQTEVLVIGSGGAGLRAAIELHDKKVDVMVVGKCKRREAHTQWATGGINSALANMDPKDTWQLHAADTIKDGGYINDTDAVLTLCKEAPKAVKELAKWGAKFNKEKNGKLSQRFFGAATYRRASFIGDHTGLGILNTLVDQVLKRKKIKFKSETYVFSLLMSKGKVNGALALDIKSGKILVIHAKKVILATGGHSRMFKRSSSRFFENNGDGINLAYKVGCDFMDMEMFQFHPTGMVWPEKAEGILATEAIRGEGGYLINNRGERFMKYYDKERMELSARDIVAQAIYYELKVGHGSKKGGVYLDITHQPKSYILKRLPKMYKQFKDYCKIDISKQRMEVAPTAHYSMGGIKIDHKTGRTKIPNLFAIGEVTSGVHGGNRLGGNSLAEICVFGRLTGGRVAKEAKKAKFIPLDDEVIEYEMDQFENKLTTTGKDPIKIKKEIMQLMWDHCGVVRTEREMKAGLRALEKYKKMKLKTGTKTGMNQKLIDALDVYNMIPTCEMILLAAMHRKESRRAHLRKDYPKTLSKWKKNIIVSPAPKGFELHYSPVKKVPKTVKKDFHYEREDYHVE